MTGEDYLAAERRAILAEMVAQAPFDGWRELAFRRAVAAAGLDRSVGRRAFPGGALEVLDLYVHEADRRMAAALAELDLGEMRVRDRITTAIRIRLAQHEGEKEAVRRALAVLALPGNTRRALTGLYGTVDAIWRAAGDRSTDFNFYSKRLILAGVYSTTLLCWLDDSSPGAVVTWAFLDRRIDDVRRFEKTKARARKLRARLPDPLHLVREFRRPRRV